MKLEDLPTNEDWNSWEYVLAGHDYTAYSGAFSVLDFSRRVDDITEDRIARVDLWFGESPEGYGSQDFVALVELTDGAWAACMAWADTTGWGCQDGVEWKVGPDRQLVIEQGLDRAARIKLGVALDGESS